jgi:hypothetical protein
MEVVMSDVDLGALPSGSGSCPSDGAASVSAVPASIPNAQDFAALEAAAKALFDACNLADAREELADEVDGTLMDALSDALDWRYPVIWTQEQVEALNASQDGYGHPFTCGGDRGDEAHRAYAEESGDDFGQLIATRRGWVCPVCDYRQTWAHGFQFDGARQSPFASGIDARSDETAKPAQPAGQEPGPQGDAQPLS